MALDWNKDISFAGLKKAAPRKRRESYPTKTYMNFTLTEKRDVDVRRALPLAIVIMVLVGLFLKFGVFDFIGQVSAKQAELAQQQVVDSGLKAELAGYDEVLERYQSFVSAQRAADSSTVGAMDALAVVDEVVAPLATVSALDYEDNTLTVSVSGVTLQSVGELVSALNARPIVESVSVPTVGSDSENAADVVTVVTIVLKSGGGR